MTEMPPPEQTPPDQIPPPPGQTPPGQIPPPPGLGTDPHPGRTIAKSARELLRKDTSLSLLPLIGGLCALLAGAPLLLAQLVFTDQTPIQYVLYAIAVFIGTTVTTFFAVALAAGAATRMDGGDPTITSCIGVAKGNIWSIVQWALFATVIGLLLRGVESKLKRFGGPIFRAIGDATFSVASYFVIPMLAHEKIGPMNALKESAFTIRTQWRKALRFNLRLGLWAVVVFLAAGTLLVGSIVAGVAIASAGDSQTINVFLGIALGASGFVVFVWAMLYVSAVSTYGRTALYRFATGRPVPGFSSEALMGAAKVAKS
jgi:hypothetical protein